MSLKPYFKKLSNENKGFIFGFVGIIIFSITPVATKIALGFGNNELSPEFITLEDLPLQEYCLLLIYFYQKKKYRN
jgi:hypothetical protein